MTVVGSCGATVPQKTRFKQAWFIGRAPASLARRFVAIAIVIDLLPPSFLPTKLCREIFQ
jgi:hypothetical protein